LRITGLKVHPEMQTTPIEFTGWDAYKYTPLKGTFEVRINDRWLPYEPDAFSCAMTYRFTPEDTRPPMDIAAQAAAENRYVSGDVKSVFIAGFKEGAIWLARERNAQEAKTAALLSEQLKREAAQEKREQQETAHKQSGGTLQQDKLHGTVAGSNRKSSDYQFSPP
jgi:hypothetical protein